MANASEKTYPLRAAARLTGLSPELLRAWERRYAAVDPMRTEGGTRRYRASDLERLRRLKAAVDAGYRISEVARLDEDALDELLRPQRAATDPPLEAVLDTLDRLDGSELHRLLSLQLATLGPVRFAGTVAVPLLHEIGARWASGRLGIAGEHMASAVLRSLLGSALIPGVASRLGPRIVFATLGGERHELGLQMAALTAMSAGANPVYLGLEVPVEDLLASVSEVSAQALALGMVSEPGEPVQRSLGALRGGLPEGVALWLGGPGGRGLPEQAGIEVVDSLDQLEQRVALLVLAGPGD